ncbi:tyrosine-type recombinase/integrase [Streptomyces sp. AP-93]|uniref:tyrosine-type recombinase/integrase n=1 Tax=Streptomyces sp. AP-93 TaxID=2929048 RepID=UPI001FAFD722|nr:tyrosine-type recombinase/integrase [Streptomyces sp. AP-93]MCJ0868130.1 tyrosine-type recombinase/integrase [Streptomyces sp. AP-93]
MPYDRWHWARPPKEALACPHSSPAECAARHPEAPRCEHKGKFAQQSHGAPKRWQARWRDPDGAQDSEAFTKETDAKKHENKMRSEVDAGTYIDPKKGKMLMSALVDMWLGAKQYPNPRSHYQVESRTRVHIKDQWIGGMQLNEVTASTILRWIVDRKRVLDETYVGLILSEMQSMFDLAVDDDLIRKNPCRAFTVKQQKPRRSKPTAKELPITWEQSDKIRVELADRWKAIVDVGRGLGLRQGEIFGLSDIDIIWDHPDGPMVHVQRQIAWDGSVMVFDGAKGEDDLNPKDRWIELGEEVGIALLEHMEKYPPIEVTLPHETKDGDPVTVRIIFYSREKKPVNKNYFNSFVWKPALAAVGIIADLDPELKAKGKRRWEKSRDKMMHALRHLYASMMIEAGVDIYTLADRLGHADPAFTLRKYVHRVASAGAKVRSALRNMYGTAA